ADRSDALRTLLPDDVAGRLDVEAAAKRCDGFVVGDLCRVVRRALLQTTVRGDNVLTDEHLLAAVDASRPVGQRSVQRVDNGDAGRNWDEVGGMTEVRLVLTQVLLWPLQYPTLFSSCPIRVSRGVLLHGPSGCGKTLIAGVIAAQSKLNFIAVKGPELLSKYIGASEQSVRETFER
uniref:ATPase AAA-type core domain-containing protein n=1 Tax=Plectus sambesii TaxID=2011161 RepID=A0A914V948_9BILA